MRQAILLCLSFMLFVGITRSQTIVLLPSAGVQTTISTIDGVAPGINSSRQYQTNLTGSLRAYIDNNKGRGFFFGITAANHGISVETFSPSSYGKIASLSTVPRIELRYQLLTSSTHFN